MLIRITSPYFCAGLVLNERTAPILHYMKNWSFEQIQEYCVNKNWQMEWLKI